MSLVYEPATINEVQEHLLALEALLHVLVHRLGGNVKLSLDDYINYHSFAKDNPNKVFDLAQTPDLGFILSFKDNITAHSQNKGTLYVGRERIDETTPPAGSDGLG